MFEFDEHFTELEMLQSEDIVSTPEDQNMLPFWSYVGNDVWKLDPDVDALQLSHDWLLKTADIA